MQYIHKQKSSKLQLAGTSTVFVTVASGIISLFSGVVWVWCRNRFLTTPENVLSIFNYLA
jgi:hypothetical protein